jgi:hypothetical protein
LIKALPEIPFAVLEGFHAPLEQENVLLINRQRSSRWRTCRIGRCSSADRRIRQVANAAR